MLRESTTPPYKAYDLHLAEIGADHLRPGDLLHTWHLIPFFDQLKYGDICRVHGKGYVVEVRGGYERNGGRDVWPRSPADPVWGDRALPVEWEYHEWYSQHEAEFAAATAHRHSANGKAASANGKPAKKAGRQ
jgi:hypothetical protein